MNKLEARMADLETRQAFQDDTLHTLNDVIVQQQQHIEQLKRQLEHLQQRIHEQPELTEIINEPPPHY